MFFNEFSCKNHLFAHQSIDQSIDLSSGEVSIDWFKCQSINTSILGNVNRLIQVSIDWFRHSGQCQSINKNVNRLISEIQQWPLLNDLIITFSTKLQIGWFFFRLKLDKIIFLLTPISWVLKHYTIYSDFYKIENADFWTVLNSRWNQSIDLSVNRLINRLIQVSIDWNTFILKN